jgi:hypothetical protein
MLKDGNARRGIGLRRPSAAAHFGHVEVCWYLPTKTILHGLVKVV